MGGILMGLDNGGSTIKCALFDLAGNELGVGSSNLPLAIPQAGWTERDCEDVWRANLDAIREAIRRAGVDPADILAVGLTGYGNGACFVDAAGNPTYNCIVSTDSRASGYLAKWEADGTMQKVYDRTYQKIWAAQPAALIPWFRDHRPDVLANTAYTLDIKDYIRFRLTGALCGEVTAASSGCLMNIKTLQFDPEIFRLLGIENYFGINPPYVPSTAVSGRITPEAAAATGLPAGLPVSGGYFDIDAGALASGILTDDMLCLIAGTWSINEYITSDLESGYGKFSNTVGYLPGHYVVEDSSPTSASNFDWFVEKILAAERPGVPRSRIYRECDEKLAAMSPCDSDVIFVPYLFASATNPLSQGAFFGLSGFHDRDHLLQAVYEGVAFSTVFHVKSLTKGRDGRYGRARFSGGVAKSPVWTQMVCDALQLPLDVVAGSELSALGAAMSAGIACGAFADQREAVERMVRLSRSYAPNPERAAAYAEKYEKFARALQALDLYHAT